MIKIPSQNKKFSQTNQSDRFGNIYRTKNISFDEPGYITLSKPTRVVADSNSLTNLQDSTLDGYGITNSTFAESQFWISGTEALYKSDYFSSTINSFPNFVEDTETGTPTLQSTSFNDLISWDDDLFATNGFTVYKWNGTTWSTFSTENGFQLEPYVDLNQLAIIDDSQVKLVDRSGNLKQTLEIPDDLEISCAKWNNNRLYIGTANKLEEDYCLILEWDGVTPEANVGHRVESKIILSLTEYKNGVAYTTSDGELGYCYGGLQPLAYFPIWYTNQRWITRLNSFPLKIGFSSMQSKRDKIYMAVWSENDYLSEDNTERFNPDFPSGVWCYDPEVGLHHKFSIGQSKCYRTDDIATTDVDTTTDVITVSGVTVPETGTPCVYNGSQLLGGTEIGGIKQGIVYFTIKESSTTLKLATTRTNALTGTAIDLTGSGNDNQFISFHEEYDFGGIANIPTHFNKIDNSDSRYVGSWKLDNFLVGGTQQFGSSTPRDVLTFSAVQRYFENRGYIITPKLESSNITDNVISLNLKWKKLKKESDKIVIKYKNKDSDLEEYTTGDRTNFTLTANDTLTTTQDLTGVEVGDELEITSGAGAGYLAHVTSISESAGTWTVEFDEEIRNFTANDRGVAIFQSWKKLDTIDINSQYNDFGYKTITLNKSSKWTQFKIELRGVEVKIEDIIINNKTERPI